MLPISYYITLSLILFGIGMAGVMLRRNAIVIFMCIECFVLLLFFLPFALPSRSVRRSDAMSTKSSGTSD